MKRIIIDFNKLTEELKTLFSKMYPDGYSVNDLISFQNVKGETIEAIELKSDEAVYLVKVKKTVLNDSETENDEEFDSILNSKEEDEMITVGNQENEDIEELEDEFEDDSDNFFDMVD